MFRVLHDPVAIALRYPGWVPFLAPGWFAEEGQFIAHFAHGGGRLADLVGSPFATPDYSVMVVRDGGKRYAGIITMAGSRPLVSYRRDIAWGWSCLTHTGDVGLEFITDEGRRLARIFGMEGS